MNASLSLLDKSSDGTYGLDVFPFTFRIANGEVEEIWYWSILDKLGDVVVEGVEASGDAATNKAFAYYRERLREESPLVHKCPKCGTAEMLDVREGVWECSCGEVVAVTETRLAGYPGGLFALAQAGVAVVADDWAPAGFDRDWL